MPNAQNRFSLIARARQLAGAVAATALVAACAATPPPYEPAATASDVGYTDTRIEDNRFRVTYTARSTDPASTAQDLALYRAADLTIQNGFDWFQIVTETVDAAPQASNRPRLSVGIGGSSGSYGSSTGVGLGLGFGGGGSAAPTTARLEVVMGLGADARPDGAYDAQAVLDNLAPQLTAAP